MTGSKQPYVKLTSLFFSAVSYRHATSIRLSYLKSALHDVPELLRLRITRVLQFQGASLLNNLFRGEGSACVPPPRV